MSDLLDSAHPDLREAIELTAERRNFDEGQTVFKRGDPGLAIYIIEKGSVRIHDGDLELNRLSEGNVFGEIAGLGGFERTATVTALEHLAVLRIEREALYEAIQTRPDALKSLVQILCEREGGMANRMTRRTSKLRAAEQELEIGRRIQAGFLPDTLPDLPGYEIASHFQAARVVAGDFYDAFYIPAIDRLALVLGDVCDKGVGAALFMTLFRSLIRATAQSGSIMNWATDYDPEQVPVQEDRASLADATLTNTIALANNYVATTHGKTSMFASVFVGLIEPESGNLSYINAGHEEAYVVGANGIRATLPPTGPVVGLFAGANHAITKENLGQGEAILLYSDGVPEATDAAGEQFSDTRIRELLDSSNGGAGDLLARIINAVTVFAEGAHQHDDITMLASYRESV